MEVFDQAQLSTYVCVCACVVRVRELPIWAGIIHLCTLLQSHLISILHMMNSAGERGGKWRFDFNKFGSKKEKNGQKKKKKFETWMKFSIKTEKLENALHKIKTFYINKTAHNGIEPVCVFFFRRLSFKRNLKTIEPRQCQRRKSYD